MDLQVYPSMLSPKGDKETSSLDLSTIPEDISTKILAALTENADLDEAVSFYEKILIQEAISRNGALQDTAIALGLPRSTFDNKRKKYGL